MLLARSRRDIKIKFEATTINIEIGGRGAGAGKTQCPWIHLEKATLRDLTLSRTKCCLIYIVTSKVGTLVFFIFIFIFISYTHIYIYIFIFLFLFICICSRLVRRSYFFRSCALKGPGGGGGRGNLHETTKRQLRDKYETIHETIHETIGFV